MGIEEIFTEKNIEILKLLDKDSYHIREIAEKLGISPATVVKAVKTLEYFDLVSEESKKNKRVISLKRNATYEKIMSLLYGQDTHQINIYDAVSPLDFRYYGRNPIAFSKVQPYLSETALTNYMLKVEVALTKVLAKRGICSMQVAKEVEQAARKVTAEEVYAEEDRIKHNVRALANCIRDKVSDEAKPFVHFTTTSHDIINTAESARFKDFTLNALVPSLVDLQKTLINLAMREKKTLQMGRTHGQHAEPITFGFAIAMYVDRLGNVIVKIKEAAENLRGKIAGAVGSYNASSLFFSDAEEFEKEILKEMGLKPSPISSQIVEPEYILDLLHQTTAAFGIMANLSDDMRHLQRSEIGEVGEEFEKLQVGSSTMPQKRNPINFENVKSMWKAIMPMTMTGYMDQISEHQRDLTNSASSRFIPEMLTSLYVSVLRLNRVMSKLVVDKNNMIRNFDMNRGMIVAEPLYILLAAHNHPDAHEYVREMTLEAQKTGKPLQELVKVDEDIQPYLKKFTKQQLDIINNPENYTGIAEQKVEKICKKWLSAELV
ncbi:lyase family protein [Nanoarchaeota archaeon]